MFLDKWKKRQQAETPPGSGSGSRAGSGHEATSPQGEVRAKPIPGSSSSYGMQLETGVIHDFGPAIDDTLYMGGSVAAADGHGGAAAAVPDDSREGGATFDEDDLQGECVMEEKVSSSHAMPSADIVPLSMLLSAAIQDDASQPHENRKRLHPENRHAYTEVLHCLLFPLSKFMPKEMTRNYFPHLSQHDRSAMKISPAELVAFARERFQVSTGEHWEIVDALKLRYADRYSRKKSGKPFILDQTQKTLSKRDRTAQAAVLAAAVSRVRRWAAALSDGVGLPESDEFTSADAREVFVEARRLWLRQAEQELTRCKAVFEVKALKEKMVRQSSKIPKVFARFFSALPSKKDAAEQSEVVARIVIQVHEARGLLGKDSNGLSDPFFEISVNGKQKHRSRTVSACLEPVWEDEQRPFDLLKGDAGRTTIMVQFWDEDSAAKADFLGQVQLDLADVPAGALLTRWYPLQKRSSRSHVAGEARISIFWQPFTTKILAPDAAAQPEDSTHPPPAEAGPTGHSRPEVEDVMFRSAVGVQMLGAIASSCFHDIVATVPLAPAAYRILLEFCLWNAVDSTVTQCVLLERLCLAVKNALPGLAALAASPGNDSIDIPFPALKPLYRSLVVGSPASVIVCHRGLTLLRGAAIGELCDLICACISYYDKVLVSPRSFSLCFEFFAQLMPVREVLECRPAWGDGNDLIARLVERSVRKRSSEIAAKLDARNVTCVDAISFIDGVLSRFVPEVQQFGKFVPNGIPFFESQAAAYFAVARKAVSAVFDARTAADRDGSEGHVDEFLALSVRLDRLNSVMYPFLQPDMDEPFDVLSLFFSDFQQLIVRMKQKLIPIVSSVLSADSFSAVSVSAPSATESETSDLECCSSSLFDLFSIIRQLHHKFSKLMPQLQADSADGRLRQLFDEELRCFSDGVLFYIQSAKALFDKEIADLLGKLDATLKHSKHDEEANLDEDARASVVSRKAYVIMSNIFACRGLLDTFLAEMDDGPVLAGEDAATEATATDSTLSTRHSSSGGSLCDPVFKEIRITLKLMSVRLCELFTDGFCQDAILAILGIDSHMTISAAENGEKNAQKKQVGSGYFSKVFRRNARNKTKNEEDSLEEKTLLQMFSEEFLKALDANLSTAVTMLPFKLFKQLLRYIWSQCIVEEIEYQAVCGHRWSANAVRRALDFVEQARPYFCPDEENFDGLSQEEVANGMRNISLFGGLTIAQDIILAEIVRGSSPEDDAGGSMEVQAALLLLLGRETRGEKAAKEFIRKSGHVNGELLCTCQSTLRDWIARHTRDN